VNGPRLIPAALPITRTGGHNHSFSREADGADEVRKAVREQVKLGAECIKLMASEGYMHRYPHRAGLSINEMRAAVDEAHRLGIQVTVHSQGPVATKNSLLAGVDSVEHATDAITDEVIDLFLKTGIPLDSTSSSAVVVAGWTPAPDLPNHLIEPAKRHARSEAEGLARVIAAGVRVSGSTDFYGTMALQAQLLAAAGMPLERVVAAITSVSAGIVKREDIGLLASGRRADVLVVRGDPSRDLTALERVAAVYKGGKLVHREIS
jgi:imidazolonepropionase-like amidohydrolase